MLSGSNPDEIPATVLRLRDIARVYPSGEPGLTRVDLDVREGEFLAIMGPSGAGKSTLLNIVGLLDTPTSGSYFIGNEDAINAQPAKIDRFRGEFFGFVFQASHVLPFESVERNVALGLSNRGLSLDDESRRVSDALNAVGMLHKVGSLARDLSGGEKQRVAIARAIASKPKILLADEPTGNLDSANSAQIMMHLRDLHQNGVTIIVITHDPQVASYAETVVNVVDGQLSRPLDGSIQPLRESMDGRTGREALGAAFRHVREALNALTSRPARSGALLMAFLLGAAAIVASMGIGSSGSQQVADRLAQSALDELYVYLPPDVSAVELNSQIEAIKALDRVEAVGILSNLSASDARIAGPLGPLESTESQITGVLRAADSEFLMLSESVLSPRTAFSAFPLGSAERVALVGATASEELGIGGSPVGQTIWIFSRPFTIVGEITHSGRNGYLGSAVVVPAKAFPLTAPTLVVRTEVGYPAAVADAIPLAVNPSNPGSVDVSTVVDYRALRVGVAGDLARLISISSIVLLVVTTLAASVSMFLAVNARISEIALRRAIGLSARGVASIHVLEGAFLGLAGGFAGLGVGSLTAVAVAYISDWTAVLPPISAAIGLLAGLAAGVVSSLVPALRAARVSPALAIRA